MPTVRHNNNNNNSNKADDNRTRRGVWRTVVRALNQNVECAVCWRRRVACSQVRRPAEINLGTRRMSERLSSRQRPRWMNVR